MTRDLFSKYGTIFIGYLIWWGELPPIVHSFLELADLPGKKVYLFNTHGGSAGTETEIAEILSDSDVSSDNLVISRDTVADSEPEIRAWLQGLGY